MKQLLLAVAALSLLATSILPADAGYCTTRCTTSGNTRTCNTYCY